MTDDLDCRITTEFTNPESFLRNVSWEEISIDLHRKHVLRRKFLATADFNWRITYTSNETTHNP